MEDIKKIDKEINKLTKRGEIQQAIEYCQNLLIDEPTDTNLHIRLGDLYMDWHLDIYKSELYIDEAVTEYQKAAEVLIDNGEIYYKIAVALYYKGELDKAINYFNIAIEKKYNIAQCYYMIAKSLSKKDRYQDALENIDNALKHSFLNTSRIHYQKARLLNALYFRDNKKKIQAVIEQILAILTIPFDKESIKEIKNKIRALSVYPTLLRGDAYFSQGKIEEAFQVYSDVIEKMPGSSLLYTILGDAYKKIGRLDEAVIEYKMAIWIDSLNHSAYSGLVQTYEEMGDYDNAITYYKKYIRIHPYSAVLHSNIANIYFMKGEVEKAVEHYQAAITLNPKPDWTSIVAQTLGFIQQNVTKNIDSAIANYQLSHAFAPKEIDVFISLGSAFYDNEDYKNALICYRRALELEPKNSKIHCNLGYLYWGMGKLDEAIKEYNLSIKYDSTYDIAHNNLGVIYLDDLVQLQNAIDCFNKAVECNPNYALAYYNLGRSYSLRGEKIKAAEYFQQAMDINNITNEIDPADIQERLNSLFD